MTRIRVTQGLFLFVLILVGFGLGMDEHATPISGYAIGLFFGWHWHGARKEVRE